MKRKKRRQWTWKHFVCIAILLFISNGLFFFLGADAGSIECTIVASPVCNQVIGAANDIHNISMLDERYYGCPTCFEEVGGCK